MQRRGFLRLLGLSPVAAPLAAKEAVGTMVASQSVSVGSCGPAPESPEWTRLYDKVSEFRNGLDTYVEPNPRIESMKSWSRVYKNSEARKDFLERQKLRNRIERVLYDNHMSIAEKTIRLAALGVK
jgi:hypothetical protein